MDQLCAGLARRLPRRTLELPSGWAHPRGVSPDDLCVQPDVSQPRQLFLVGTRQLRTDLTSLDAPPWRPAGEELITVQLQELRERPLVVVP